MTNNFPTNSHLQNQNSEHIEYNISFSGVTIRAIFDLFSLFLIFLLVSCASTPSLENIKQAEAYNKIGYSYLNNGQLNEAFIEFQKALSLDPNNTETLNYLGYISARFKKYDEAISYYNQAISLDPDYSDAVNNLGVTYAEMENWDDAIKHFRAALSNPLYRTPARAYSNMGYAYYKKGDYVNAEHHVQDALLRNPVFPRAMYILGLIYMETNNVQAAIEEFKKAIGILPEYVDVHWELARAYLKAGKKGKALKHFKVVFEKDNNKERRRKSSNYIEQLKY